PPLGGGGAWSCACRGRGGPTAVRRSGFHQHLAAGLRLPLCGRPPCSEPSARPAGRIGPVCALCSLQGPPHPLAVTNTTKHIAPMPNVKRLKSSFMLAPTRFPVRAERARQLT